MEQNTNMGTQMSAEKTPMGSIIGIIVIVLVLAGGAYYFLKQVPEPGEGQVLTPSETQADATISNLSKQGTSTNINDIKKDLNSTNLNNLDAGMSDITI